MIQYTKFVNRVVYSMTVLMSYKIACHGVQQQSLFLSHLHAVWCPRDVVAVILEGDFGRFTDGLQGGKVHHTVNLVLERKKKNDELLMEPL